MSYDSDNDLVDDLDELISDYSDDPEFVEALHAAEDRSRLRAALSEQRRLLGLSQSQVATSMGTTQSHVSDFENGETDSQLSTFQRYARSVGLRLTLSLESRPAARQLTIITVPTFFPDIVMPYHSISYEREAWSVRSSDDLSVAC